MHIPPGSRALEEIATSSNRSWDVATVSVAALAEGLNKRIHLLCL